MSMIALVDCNSFFCSVEKAFHPGLRGKPVCVLSSNDGCLVALTPEAKALGLRRGDPVFKVRDIIERHHVVVFSGNMQLYAAMSRRIVHILRQSVSYVENYSIDESFCYLDGYERLYDLENFMRGVADKIRLWTDVPVSVGIAPTKTLAKMGSKFAKEYRGYRGVCRIDDERKRRKALELFDLSEVWGIGHKTLARLNGYGVYTSSEFAGKSASWVRARFPKPVYQTWLELNGVSCIDTKEVLLNQSVCFSRSFGEMVTDLASLRASVASFSAGCANKLRAQHAGANTVTVFVYSNRFRNDLPQYANAATAGFQVPTSDSIEISRVATDLLEQLYRPGICYKKSGVILSGITDLSVVQGDLFDPVERREERRELMSVIDSLNHRYGLHTVRLMAEGEEKQAWKVRSEHRSPNYLTDIHEILTVHI